MVQLNQARRLTHDWVEVTNGWPQNDTYTTPADGVGWLTYDGVNPWPGGPGARGDMGATLAGF